MTPAAVATERYVEEMAKEIKKLMDSHNYDFYAWEKRCPVNWVEKVDEEKLKEK